MKLRHATALLLFAALLFHPAISALAQQSSPPPDLSEESEAELDREYQAVQYLLNDKTRSEMKAIKQSWEKRKYLRELYEKLDAGRSEGEPPFRTMFYKRLDLADELYSTPMKEGWKRDRGRVLIQYGEPDDIERTQYIEAWQYYGIEGGVVFIFDNTDGLGIWKLVHSTKQGEIYNPHWSR